MLWWSSEGGLKREAARLLEDILVRGEVERGEPSRITGLPERSARRVPNEVESEGVGAFATPKGPISLRFPTHSVETLFPRLTSTLRFGPDRAGLRHRGANPESRKG